MELRDVPSIGFTTSDRPNPRGEIAVKSENLCLGYYKGDEKTRESLQGGFFLTGDIGEIDASGKLKMLTRKKDLLEIYLEGKSLFFSPHQVEAVLTKCEKVESLLVHGQRDYSFLIVVVVPKFTPSEEKQEELCKDVLVHFQKLAQQSNLPVFKVPKAVILDVEGWNTENGMMLGIAILEKHEEKIRQKMVQL